MVVNGNKIYLAHNAQKICVNLDTKIHIKNTLQHMTALYEFLTVTLSTFVYVLGEHVLQLWQCISIDVKQY